MADNTPGSKVAVWDPLVRIGHWALVAAFTIAYLTGEEGHDPGDWHEWAGYAAGAIVIWRVLWGFIGPRNARFSDFTVSARSAAVYLIDLVAGRSRRYIGHSPAGGAMIIALLGFLAATVATGVLADPDGRAPPARSEANASIKTNFPQEIRAALTAKGERGYEDSVIGELHAALANITLGLVVLHILGVGLASFVHRENLVAAMITGKKREGVPD